MKVVLLAGGFGTRISEESQFKPKPMVDLGGMPILDVGWGYECYTKALEKGIGTKLKLWDTPFMA